MRTGKTREPESEHEVFLVEARRCKRCGGLLTSKQAVADGYGHVCKMKAERERLGEPQIPGQVSMFDFYKDKGGPF